MQSIDGTSSESWRPENMRKKCIWNKNLTCGLYIWLPNHCYPRKAPISQKKTKTNYLTPFTGKPLLRLRLLNNYSSSPNGLWVNSPWGRRLLNKTLFGEASPRGPVPYPYIYYLAKGTPFVYLPLKSSTLIIYLLHENKSVRKEVFRSFSCNL